MNGILILFENREPLFAKGDIQKEENSIMVKTESQTIQISPEKVAIADKEYTPGVELVQDELVPNMWYSPSFETPRPIRFIAIH